MAISAALPVSTLSCCASHSPKKARHLDSFGQILRKDHEFIKRGFEKLKLNYLPVISKTINDVFWMRNFENPNANLEPLISPPPPFYPGLSGVDLMMADLEAIWEYAHYFYHAAKISSRPLPDIYDPETVADYFKRRPHIVAFRVLEVLSSFASAVVKMRISKILNLKTIGAIKDDSRNSSEYYMGHLLKETMLNLGPTFIKVGQSLSTRPDIIGSEISKVLSELHDQIPPFPSAVAMEIIEEELGCPVETIFSYISEEPVAAASFGQVYRSYTIDGCTVAVKVQRPNLHHSVLRDIYILRLGLMLLQRVAKRKSDLSLYADELGKGFVGELDYTIEAANASEFLEAHARFPFIYVPKILGHLSRKRVLTMEWVVGESPNKLLNQSRGLDLHDVEYSERQEVEARTHLLDLVNKGVEATLVQLLETGLLHADPHAGNLRYTPAGQIGFLDFGLVCRMERKHQFAMLASILHIVNGAWASLVYDLIEMDVVRPGTNLRRVIMELEDSLGEVVFKDGIPDIKFSKVLGKIWSIAIKYHFRMPPYYTLLLRSLASFEGLAVAADPNFKTFQAAYPYVVRKLLTDNSAATRRILHSVVFNKRKEFQWHKLAAFLKVSATRKGIQGITSIDWNSPPQNIRTRQNGALEIAQLILRLLPSKDGAVLRRMLMTADPTSLIRAMISKEAVVYRHHLCQALADLLHQWMVQSLRGNNTVSPPLNSHVRITSIHQNREAGPSESYALFNWVLLTDRRLKVIYSRVIKALRKDPILMLRFYWTCFIMSISASALACHRLLVSWYKMYISSVQLLPNRFAVSV